LLAWDEQIKAHLMWIWGGEVGLMKRGREGMFVITDKRIAFISKTNMSYRMHDVYSNRQRIRLEHNENAFRPIDDYGITELRQDLDKDLTNMQFEYNRILDLYAEEKRWGTALRIDVEMHQDIKKSYKFSVVKSWVKYPAKDPLQFHHMDWIPVITLFENFKKNLTY
jgi:hypothetical protein